MKYNLDYFKNKKLSINSIINNNEYNDIYNIQNMDNNSINFPSYNCKNCKCINNLIQEYNKENDYHILYEINKLEMNGYELIDFYEQNGLLTINSKLNINDNEIINYYNNQNIIDITNYDKIKEVSNYVNDNYNINDVKLIREYYNNNAINLNLSQLRFCKFCGARKPDLIKIEEEFIPPSN